MNHHPAYPDRLMDESLLFPQGVSPPPHANSMHGPPGSTVNQLLRRAAAEAALRRVRNNSGQSDEVSLKRHRGMDNGILGNSNNNGSNNNSSDVANQMTQITATDFSTSNIKHNNNNNNSVLNNNSLNNNSTPPIKDIDRHSDSGKLNGQRRFMECESRMFLLRPPLTDLKGSSIQSSNRDSVGNNGAGPGDKDSHSSLTPSPRMSGEDVKSEPMELVCGPGGGPGNNNNSINNSMATHEDHSNDSVTENEINHTGSNPEIKGHLRYDGWRVGNKAREWP